MQLLKEDIIEIKEVFTDKLDGNEYDGFELKTENQTIKLLMDVDVDCCEYPGYFFCNEDYMSFIGAKLISLSISDTALNEAIMVKNNESLEDMSEFEGNVMFVNIETSRGTLQFVAYNEHNGHYGHDAKIYVNTLFRSEIL